MFGLFKKKKSDNMQEAIAKGKVSQKDYAFSNAVISIKHFIEQQEVPEELTGHGSLEKHANEMCSPLYNELNLTDKEWQELDRNILALMIFGRYLKEYFLKEYFIQKTPKLYELHLKISEQLIWSITEGGFEITKNDISYKFGQKEMNEISKLW
jgi:hypothetical protein